MTKSHVLIGCMFLFVVASSCSIDPYSSNNPDVVVTIQGASAFGDWQREFIGPESQADAFASEAAAIVSRIAEKFNGTIDVVISINNKVYKRHAISGNDEQVVPAAILATHDIIGLRLGFLPTGSLDRLAVASAVAGARPCTCVGSACCCESAISGGYCGNIEITCEGCKGIKDPQCIGGTQCWFGQPQKDQ